jgi:hypothetical protein
MTFAVHDDVESGSVAFEPANGSADGDNRRKWSKVLRLRLVTAEVTSLRVGGHSRSTTMESVVF